jgi:hypothetical protein
MTRIALEPYFLHQDQVQSLLGEQRAESARARAARRSDPEAALPYVLATELAEALPALRVGELARCALEQDLRAGQVVGAELKFDFQRDRDRDAPGFKPVSFTAALDEGMPVRVTGTFNSARTASSSATGSLTGSRRAYLIGTVTDLAAERIELRPVFIGVRSFIDDNLAARDPAPGLRVYPSDIGQFSGIDFTRPVSEIELDAVLHVPEEEVKRALAGLVSESYVPKDWGGERSDLYTSRVFVRGRQVSAAWLLKGPSYPRAMDVRALGKNGDQIDRLFTEPAELLVLQHCHQIKPSVVSMMDSYAHDTRRPRSYMIIDGADTGRILRSLGLLPVTSAHPSPKDQRSGNLSARLPAAAATSEPEEASEYGDQTADDREILPRFRSDLLVRRPVSWLPKTQADSKPPRLESALDGQVFEHILGVIRMQARQMEQSPATYAGMGEEDRRQTIVATLNTHYSGRAHAEAFNNQGKTDILIRYEGRNLFICECKFWSGPEGFSKTVDQLFHYAGWRDTKLAIIMFVRQKALTAILSKGKQTLARHTTFVAWETAANETELRAKVHWPGDQERLSDLNVFFVHTP